MNPFRRKQDDIEDQEDMENIVNENTESTDNASQEVNIEDSIETEPVSEIDTLRIERDEADGRAQRALADFHNYQKRARQSEQQAKYRAKAAIIRDLLPVMDNFDMACGIVVNSDDAVTKGFVDGVQMVHNTLNQVLESHGVSSINIVEGEEFDPNLHQAMMLEESDDIEPNNIIRCMQTGYKLDDIVIRPATVVVAKEQSKIE